MIVSPGSALFDAVTVAVGSQVDAVEEAHRTPLDYDAFLAHREVNRLHGTASVAGERVPWSLIEKITEGPDLAIPYLVDNGEREYAAYGSGLLDDLAPGVRAPRAYGSERTANGRITLWIEQIHHSGPRPLDAETILAAAGDLGVLAAQWLGRVPDEPWLFTDWITRHSQPEAADEGRAVLSRSDPQVLARIGHHLPGALRLLDAQPRLRDLLESLPTTLCHHDAVGANVFRTPDGTVLIDWESVGPGPVGADLASLLFSSARRGDFAGTLLAAVLEPAFAAYFEGFRSSGGTLDEQTVRLGFDAAIGLRWKLVRDIAESLERGTASRRGSAPDESPETALAELAGPIAVLLASADRVLS